MLLTCHIVNAVKKSTIGRCTSSHGCYTPDTPACVCGVWAPCALPFPALLFPVASRGLGGVGESPDHSGSWGLEALNAAQESQVQRGGSLA